VKKLYKRNEIAAGAFVALGRQVVLAAMTAPTFLLAASDDELVAPPQLFATERLIGTSAPNIAKALAPGRHVSLFVGKTTLNDVWPRIVRWIEEPTWVDPHEEQARAIENVHAHH